MPSLPEIHRSSQNFVCVIVIACTVHCDNPACYCDDDYSSRNKCCNAWELFTDTCKEYKAQWPQKFLKKRKQHIKHRKLRCKHHSFTFSGQ